MAIKKVRCQYSGTITYEIVFHKICILTWVLEVHKSWRCHCFSGQFPVLSTIILNELLTAQINGMFCCLIRCYPQFHWCITYITVRHNNYRAGESIGEYGKLTVICQYFSYLPIFSLPVIYSIGAYLDNLMPEFLLLSCCYNKTW